MKILVTGGAGFVGNHLANKLKNLGHKVLIVDFPKKDMIKNISNNFDFYGFDLSANDWFIEDNWGIVFDEQGKEYDIEEIQEENITEGE